MAGSMAPPAMRVAAQPIFGGKALYQTPYTQQAAQKDSAHSRKEKMISARAMKKTAAKRKMAKFDLLELSEGSGACGGASAAGLGGRGGVCCRRGREIVACAAGGVR